MSQSRREFLRNLGILSGGAWLSGCSTLDRWLLEDTFPLSHGVVILGAGVAGLTAALELKRANIPFQIYEGSARIGGRVYTLNKFGRTNQDADLGADRILPEHTATLNLIKDLRLNLFERKKSAAWDLYTDRWLSRKEADQGLARLRKNFAHLEDEIYGKSGGFLDARNALHFPLARKFDHYSAAELIATMGFRDDTWLKQYLDTVVMQNWGVDSEQISALHLVHWARRLKSPEMDQRTFQINGGMGLLVQALYDRVAGVLPDRVVIREHSLQEIQYNDNRYELVFSGPRGKRIVKEQTVICTLPFSVLKDIEGVENLPIKDQQKSLIYGLGYGNHSRLVVSTLPLLSEKVSRLEEKQWLYLKDNFAVWSEVHIPTPNPLAPKEPLYRADIGGTAGAQGGEESIKRFLESFAGALASPSFTGEQILATVKDTHIQNWNFNKWSKGSIPFFRPGQYSLFDPQQATEGRWIFAGDHISYRWAGTLNGAIESGISAGKLAAQQVV